MKYIELTKDKRTIVDDADYGSLSQWSWYYKKQADGNGGYAARNSAYVRGKPRTTIRMHQQILPAPVGFETDHENGDKLDNRRSNLRIVTKSQNMWNRKKQKGTSKYKGVYWNKSCKKWFAQLRVHKGYVYLGLFEVEEEAALAYQEAARNYHGKYARFE